MIIRYITVVALAIALCSSVLAQGKSGVKKLDSFCGFKAGESQEKLQKTAKIDPFNSYVLAKKPFRKFKHVTMEFSDAGELTCVSATMFLPKAKLDTAKKELSECGKILAKFDGMGGLATADWKTAGDNHCEKEYVSKGVTIFLYADTDNSRELPNGKKEKYAMLVVSVSWDLIVMQRKPIVVKAGNFAPDKGGTRREFVEKTFGVKFGEDISNTVKLDDGDKVAGELVDGQGGRLSNLLGGVEYIVNRELSQPVCGFSMVTFSCDKSKQLKYIGLSEHKDSTSAMLEEAKAVKLAGARVEKLRASIGKWLGAEEFEAEEPSDETDNGMVVKSQILTAKLEGDKIKVFATSQYVIDTNAKKARLYDFILGIESAD